jgi:hypothetical protein
VDAARHAEPAACAAGVRRGEFGSARHPT